MGETFHYCTPEHYFRPGAQKSVTMSMRRSNQKKRPKPVSNKIGAVKGVTKRAAEKAEQRRKAQLSSAYDRLYGHETSTQECAKSPYAVFYEEKYQEVRAQVVQERAQGDAGEGWSQRDEDVVMQRIGDLWKQLPPRDRKQYGGQRQRRQVSCRAKNPSVVAEIANLQRGRRHKHKTKAQT